MLKTTRPTRQGFGVTAHMPSASYEQRKATRNRVKTKTPKVESAKPRAHRVGRSKR